MIYGLFTEQFKALQQLLANLSTIAYTHQNGLLGASIGQHVRHTIELAQGLLTGYHSGIINYDKRKRDPRIETDPVFAHDVLEGLILQTDLPDVGLQLVVAEQDQGAATIIPTNYFRELVYNTEHTIHHMALIRVALREMNITTNEEFGVAPSTLKYRQACAQ